MMMNRKEGRNWDNRWITTVFAVAVVCFFSTFASAAEQASENLPFDANQTLLAGVTLDYPGGDTADTQMVEGKDPAFSVGLGAAMVPDYEGSEDFKGVPLLFARAAWDSGRYIQFMANRLKANIIGSENWSLGPMVQYRGKRDDDVENDKVEEMREIDPAVEIGGFVGITPGNWHLTLLAGQDVNDAHEGLVAILEGGYTMPLDQGVKLGITGFTSYVDDDYMETYFSVDADNAGRSGLDEYAADGGMKDYGVMLNLAYAPWEHWGITAILGWKQLIGDAADSPVVEDEGSDSQPFGGVMATYRF